MKNSFMTMIVVFVKLANIMVKQKKEKQKIDKKILDKK
jgi:hypothetical protein